MKDINLLKNNGIDIDSALELLGDMEMYEETLNDFLEVSEDRMPLLEKYYQENNMKDYAIQVHAMKSDSNYLGFVTLAKMSLEHQLKSESDDSGYIKEHYHELKQEANRIIRLVKNYLNK